MKSTKAALKERRHRKIRSKVSGTKDVPRLAVSKSNRHISAQIINDEKGETIVSVTDFEYKKTKKTDSTKNTNVTEAAEVGKLIAEKAKKKNIEKVVFDRGGSKYHGVIKAFADGARSGGLKF